MTPAERLAAALLSEDPLTELAAVRPAVAHDASLLAVLVAAERRLGGIGLDPDGPEAAALRAVSGHPGLSAAELGGLVDGFAAVSGTLLDLGLVSSSRFERHDCWSRTTRGAALLRAWDSGPRVGSAGGRRPAAPTNVPSQDDC
ncbi:MAG: hypothetical protein JWL64_107 [Frankiales bacterium]|nr:hypothetical protein [Frankiales bacterium]